MGSGTWIPAIHMRGSNLVPTFQLLPGPILDVAGIWQINLCMEVLLPLCFQNTSQNIFKCLIKKNRFSVSMTFMKLV